jgi:hypothetical protein
MYSALFFEMVVQNRGEEVAAAAERHRITSHPVEPGTPFLASLRDWMLGHALRKRGTQAGAECGRTIANEAGSRALATWSR